MEQVLEAVLYLPLCATPKEGFCFAGVQTEARVANLTWIGGRGILVASDPGAYKHDDTVSTVSVLSSGIQTVNLAHQMVQNSYRAHSGQATCVVAFLHKDPVFLSCGENNTILLEDICCPKPASQMGHGVSGYLLDSLTLCPQQASLCLCASCALSSGVQSYAPLLASTLRRFRSQAHRNFVSDATWSSLNHSLLTTVGWDHEVLHHFMPTEPLPEPGTKSVAE
ncbi:hypothetical protein FD755_012373 [Muntiacus reevesi]|uniref:Uncharacterized protein n=1 Tax=Muntiacus reevesi TaxID=9886 RepID=A0A5N3XQU0_MUNRE|nr:hypothetical protein FD755_012373 [Muntiacus reevesi]